jgi:DNA-binding response OmpR family regulator
MKKILVVDDEPDILKVVVFRLKKAGYEVAQTALGKEALTLMKADRPDLIVLDYRLPDMNGIDVARTMRADEALENVPIILLSASSGDDMNAAVKDADIDEYLKKPFNPDELLEKVRELVGKA